MPGNIFVNYRRGDDPGFTQFLYQRLEEEFTADKLFMDVEGHIKPGDDFVFVLSDQVEACDVLLAVIGPRWVDLLAQRAGDSDDFVAIEIKAALERGKRVIPVLVGGAGMPRAEAMPEPIRAIARRNAIGLRPERFKADCQGLITALKEQLAAAQRERSARTETERRAAEEARLRTEADASARAVAAEKQVLAQANPGLSAMEILKLEEFANWNFIEKRRDIADLRDHLARFSGGSTERYARAALEDLVWTGLGASATRAQLAEFLAEFPKGANTDAATHMIAAIDRAAATAKAAAEQAEAEAKAVEVRKQTETADWAHASSTNTLAAYQGYLQQWPGGEHVRAARTRMRELRRGSWGVGHYAIAGGVAFLALLAIWASRSQLGQVRQRELESASSLARKVEAQREAEAARADYARRVSEAQAGRKPPQSTKKATPSGDFPVTPVDSETARRIREAAEAADHIRSQFSGRSWRDREGFTAKP